ncbi:transcriptional regulator [Candidatus Poribacteria bacterium]|nr:transcriptional regulator [Candidatus Poribacteria bacterium]
MSEHPDRSHLVRHVQDAREQYLLHYGEGFLYESLPVGSRVIYPPEPLPGIPDVRGAIAQAIESPLEADPLSAQLRPGMKVTIAFDDISLTLPPMEKPDFRQTAIELLVETLTAAGITDIHLIAALGLHRRMTPKELKACVGPRIFNQFHPTGQLYNHDAEDTDNMELLGRTEEGEHVELHRRAVESDLVIYVNLNLTAMDGGHKSLNTGLTSYRSLKHHHNPTALEHSRSLMDPPSSALHGSLHRMGGVANEHVNAFHIESTCNTATFPRAFAFLEKREDQWGRGDHRSFRFNKTASDLLPRGLIRSIFMGMRAPYGITSVQAGSTDAVHARTLEGVHRQQIVPVEGQCDILVAGTPYIGPYNVNSIMNPLLVHCLMLGYMFNMYRGKPLVRPGGAIVIASPMVYEFHEGHHPSYIELFDRVFPETTDPHVISEKYEEEFATNPKYIRMYREEYAYHGVHSMYMWYWGAHALSYLSKVIVLKPQDARAVEAAQRMGFDTAATMAEALGKARDAVGAPAEVTNYHWPPIFVCDVT